MKSCAYCGRENQDQATHCRECGTSEFVVAPPPSPPTPHQLEAAEIPDPEPDVAPDGESALCTSCLFPNLPDSTWCKRCGAPVGSTTAIVPLDAALSLGYVYRGALSGHPKLVVLVGVWVLFFPGFIGNLGLLLVVLSGDMRGAAALATFWLALVAGTVCSVMLYRVTKNYLSLPKRQLDDTAT